MTDQETVDLINRSLCEEFELEAEGMVRGATLYDDLGLDSLDTVDMVIVLEKAFGIKMRDEKEIQNIRTLGDIHDFIIRKNRGAEDQA
jgi:acyl carrier protein